MTGTWGRRLAVDRKRWIGRPRLDVVALVAPTVQSVADRVNDFFGVLVCSRGTDFEKEYLDCLLDLVTTAPIGSERLDLPMKCPGISRSPRSLDSFEWCRHLSSSHLFSTPSAS
jgi:hypothetical protein